jgi:phycocyanin beta chain
MVQDAFSKVVSQADARGEYLNDGQLDALINLVKEGNKRVDIVNRISSNASAIVANAVYQKFPYTTTTSGPNYASTQTGKEKCVRDIGYYLRIVTYGQNCKSVKHLCSKLGNL